MTANGWFQIVFYLLVILLLTKPIGIFITRVFNREKTILDAVLRPIEKLIYRLIGIDEQREMRWTEYAVAMLLFSVFRWRCLYLIERTAEMAAIQSTKTSERGTWSGISAQRHRLRQIPTGKPTRANPR